MTGESTLEERRGEMLRERRGSRYGSAGDGERVPLADEQPYLLRWREG